MPRPLAPAQQQPTAAQTGSTTRQRTLQAECAAMGNKYATRNESRERKGRGHQLTSTHITPGIAFPSPTVGRTRVNKRVNKTSTGTAEGLTSDTGEEVASNAWEPASTCKGDTFDGALSTFSERGLFSRLFPSLLWVPSSPHDAGLACSAFQLFW